MVTCQLILNFGAFLEEHKHFEDGFQAYERGVAAFKYPYVLAIWLAYLTKFVQRFKGAKLERAPRKSLCRSFYTRAGVLQNFCQNL